jgi:hypothetical protein
MIEHLRSKDILSFPLVSMTTRKRMQSLPIFLKARSTNLIGRRPSLLLHNRKTEKDEFH